MRRHLPSLLAASLAFGCGEASHVFEGRLFVEGRQCLGTTSSVDVVSGERPGNCDPVCLVQSTGDGGRAIYVANMCGPYPPGFDVTGKDPACPDALGALARGDTCLVDGGSSHPSPRDAGAD